MERTEDVWRQLATVVDPELDESVTEMKFISKVDVDENDCVHIGFRLPTYWCAANFAFLMADDMRTAVRALPWVKSTCIVLDDHMYAEKINHGVASGLSFQETFGDEADGNLDDIRRTFLVKAFQRRQETLINHLLQSGLDAGRIVSLTIGDLRAISSADETQKLISRYLERRGVIAPFETHSAAFVSSENQALEAQAVPGYLGGLRRVRANAEFNGALCRGLLEVRFDMETPLKRKPGPGCKAADAPAHQS